MVFEDGRKCEGKSNCPSRTMHLVSTPEMKKAKWLCETHYQEFIMDRKTGANG